MTRLNYFFVAFAWLANSVFAQDNLSSLEQELRYVTDNAFAVAMVRPEKMFEVDGISSNPLADLAGPTGIKPSEVKQLVVAVVSGYQSISVVAIVELTKPLDPKLIQRRLSPRSTKLGLPLAPYPVFDAEQSGGLSLGFPKPNQIVVSSSLGAVFQAIEVGRHQPIPKPKLVEMCGNRTASHMFFACDIDRLEHFMTFVENTYTPEMPWGFKQFQPKSLNRIRGSFDFSTRPTVRIDLTSSGDSNDFRKEIRLNLNQVKKSLTDWLKSVESSADSVTPSELSIVNLFNSLKVLDIDGGVKIETDESTDPISIWKQIGDGLMLVRKSMNMQLQHLIAKNELRKIGLALLNYESGYNRFPTNFYDDNDSPLLSWRVAILPFIGETKLYDRFKLNEPWDSENNKALLKFMPPGLREQGSKLGYETKIQYPRGKGIGAISSKKGITFKQISDGSGNTIALVVSDRPVPWTKPDDHEVDLNAPWKNLSDFAIVGLFDGSVREIDKQTIGKKLAAAFTLASNDGTIDFNDKLMFLTIEESNRRRTKALMDRFGDAGLDQEAVDLILNSFSEGPGSKSVLELGLKLIGSQDSYEIALGQILLSKVEPTYDWKKLEPLLNHRFEYIRNRAIHLMARTGSAGVVARIFQPDSADQTEVWQALHENEIKQRAPEELLPMLSHSNPGFRISAAWAIVQFGGEKYRKQIEALLNDEDETVQSAAKEMIDSLDKAANKPEK